MENFLRKAVIAMGIGSTIVGTPDSTKGAEVAKDSKVNPVVKQMEKAVDSKIEGNYQFGTDLNEGKENLNPILFANEALSHLNKGAFVSESRPGFISICEDDNESKGGSFAYKHGYKVTSWKVTGSKEELVNGYFIDRIAVDSEDKILKEETTKKIDINFNPTNPTGIDFVFIALQSRGMSVEAIQNAFEKANPQMNREVLVSALESSNLGGELKKDIAMLKDEQKNSGGPEVAANVE